jgi:hypothetical protein
MGKAKPTVNFLFPPDSVILIYELHRLLRETGVSDEELWNKTVEYFCSPCLAHIPSINISSMLYASLARKAASGQKRPPTKGMTNDIGMISSLLPYCDAIFIDNECHTFLNEKPLCDNLHYGTCIFAPNNREGFMDYVNSIEAGMSKEHFMKIEEVTALKGYNHIQLFTQINNNITLKTGDSGAVDNNTSLPTSCVIS